MFPDIHVTVIAGSTGPLLVKTATTEEAQERLDLETARLERAHHPGVVEVHAASHARLELIWAGSETLATLRTTVPQAAALLASVSATVADLHDVGFVHGTLEPAHVVVGADGRPRLCSLGGPHHGPDAGHPAEDVAAVGRLIGTLIEPGVDVEPIPEKRWSRRRWSGYQRRTLQTLADQATHEDPARRPTARALAASIAEAVPDASLQPVAASRGRRPLPGEQPIQPVAFPTDLDRVEPAPDDTPTEPDDARHHGEPPVLPSLLDLASSEPPSTHDALESSALDPSVEHRDDQPRADRTGADGPRPAAPENHPSTANEAAAQKPDPGTEPEELIARLGLRFDQTAEGGGPDRAVPDGSPPRSGIDPARPPAISLTRPRIALASAACLLLVGLAWTWSHRSTGTSADRQVVTTATFPLTPSPAPSGDGQPPSADGTTSVAPSTPASTSTPTTPPPPTSPPPDGCLEVERDAPCQQAFVNGSRVTVGTITYQVGDEGDQVSVGDWDCDGTATPGLVRPESGEIFLFETWAGDAAPVTVDPVVVIPGAQHLQARTGDRCLPPMVQMDDDSTRPLVSTADPA